MRPSGVRVIVFDPTSAAVSVTLISPPQELSGLPVSREKMISCGKTSYFAKFPPCPAMYSAQDAMALMLFVDDQNGKIALRFVALLAPLIQLAASHFATLIELPSVPPATYSAPLRGLKLMA